jgi:aspartate aminotransferase
MISKKMSEMISGSSMIRAMFEEGKKLAAIHGPENVCDFSLGNPNLPPPPAVRKAIISVLDENEETFVHGYMNNSGYESVRAAVADSINAKFETDFTEKNIVMSVGAAGGLNVILKSIINPGDEVLVFAPFFGEYKNYASNFDAALVVVPPNAPSFQPNLVEFEKLLSPRTKAVIVNTPNNPTGVVYSEETIIELTNILRKKQAEFGTEIYLVSDEPYRELVYDSETTVPYITKYYDSTLVGCSYSKSLSLPGERIGYIVIPDKAADFENLIAAANIATRILGYVNAPSINQLMVAKCLEEKADISFYKKNRDVLVEGLSKIGFDCAKPQGAFYLWLKAPIDDDKAFCEMAKKHLLLLVPGSAFGCPGYIRIVYCVAHETILKSLPKFEALYHEIRDDRNEGL